jgi:hypothetical protein
MLSWFVVQELETKLRVEMDSFEHEREQMKDKQLEVSSLGCVHAGNLTRGLAYLLA